MQIITGDETGLVKLIDLEKKEVVKKYGEQGKEFKIIQILTLQLSEINFYLILREQSILLLDSDLNEICQQEIDQSPIKCFCDSNHKIYIIYNNRKINMIQYDESENIFTTQETLNGDDFALITNLKDKYVTSSAISNNQNLLLITYFGAPPSIFDFQKRKLFWQARNVKNDELDLQVKMNDFDGLFLDDYSVGVVTVHQTLRVYNILQNKSQPIAEHSLKHSKTKVKFIKSHNEKYFMANERGEILIYQKDFKFERAITGTFGAIRDLTLNKEYIYTVSADRFLRVYHIENVRLPLSINLSQRLTSINFSNQEYKEIEIEQKEQKIWTIKNGKEAKARFAGMRRHTIKLSYLEKMFENHKMNKNKKEKEKVKQEQQKQEYQEIKQEYEDDTQEPKRGGVENKKIKKINQKKKLLELKKKKLLVNKPRNKIK